MLKKRILLTCVRKLIIVGNPNVGKSGLAGWLASKLIPGDDNPLILEVPHLRLIAEEHCFKDARARRMVFKRWGRNDARL